MLQTIMTFAAATEPAPEAGLFESLGLNVEMLVFQSIAFLILLWLLSKYAYPIITKILDEREARILEGQKAATEALKKADAASDEIEAKLAEAKKTAEDIVSVAKNEAAKTVEDAESKAQQKADHLLKQAESRIATDIADAKNQLHGEMLGLVARATEKVLEAKIDAKTDAELIKNALAAAAKSEAK